MNNPEPSLEEVQQLLNKPLHPALIRTRPGGRNERYIPAHTAITQANRIIGAATWHVEILDHVAISNGTECIGYKCRVRVNIPRFGFKGEGIGFNALTDKDGKLLHTPQSYDTAIKGAESDAVKRALRYLGDPFGNYLYETVEERRAMAEAAIPVAAQRDGVSTDEARRVITRGYRNVDDVPLNTSMAFYDGRRHIPIPTGQTPSNGPEQGQQPTQAQPAQQHVQREANGAPGNQGPNQNVQEQQGQQNNPPDHAPRTEARDDGQHHQPDRQPETAGGPPTEDPFRPH